MHTADPLIHTKIRLPSTRPSLVSRPRLQEQMVKGLRSPLTLIIAPAGFGKTTLVAACVRDCGIPVAWLSLDKNDNQVERFLNYVVAALHETDPAIEDEAAPLMTGLQQAPPEVVLTHLINNLDKIGKDIVLVFDDYQFIDNQTVHEAVAFLLEHCPSTFHLVIASRSDPPLPLARLRGRGQMVELRATDLSFTKTEAEQFLNNVMGLRLDAESVAVLEERTEGWIAGLQMAALSMHNRKDVSAFIERFSGTNRYILDYLLEEVLAGQSVEIQQFLLYTSILERLTAPLCDAVTSTVLRAGLANNERSNGESDDPSTHSESLFFRESASILAYLEKANLFVVPLDDEQTWYRYHHLFADLLRARLAHPPYNAYQKSLHARASIWYETHGFPEDAIHHSLAAHDYPEAARQIESAAENAWLNGQYATILTWIQALPNNLVLSHPWLCIWNAWVYTQIGISQEINQWIEAAEQSAANETQDSQALMNEIAALKVFVSSFSQDYPRAICLAEDVLKRPPLKHKRASQFTRCNILHLLSSLYFATGQIVKAEEICLETIALANTIGFILRYFHATNKLILVYNVTGRLSNSDRIIQQTWLVLRDKGYSNYFATLQLHFRKIELLYEWNQMEEARRLLDLVTTQQMIIQVPYLLVDLYNLQAYLFLVKRDYMESQNVLNQATALARQSYIWEGLTWRTAWLQVKLWLQKGDVAKAGAWASQQAEDSSAVISFANEVQMVARARILLAQGACRESIELLDRLSHSADVGGRRGSLIEIRALKAIALQSMGKIDQAAAEVERALALGQPEGYVRTFLDEGQPMQRLLIYWLAHASASPMRDYALHLLSQFDTEPYSIAAPREKTSPLGGLVEPLSQREVEVLHLLALGRTNQEIARQLVVAPGTVKAHTSNIYRKLDVANRTEAVAHARQLGILP